MVMDELLTTVEAAGALGIRPWTLRRCVSDWKIRRVARRRDASERNSLAARPIRLRIGPYRPCIFIGRHGFQIARRVLVAGLPVVWDARLALRPFARLSKKRRLPARFL
jgi:hypothetical protein